MFNILKKSPKKGETITLKLSGLHCTSCSLNIDGELEDLDGVIESRTSYPKSQTTITFDPQKVNENTLRQTIIKLGYEVV
jgi:copper chaperone CopZ